MTHADISGAATALEQHNLEIALANRHRDTMKFTGRCYNCGEVVPAGNFCEQACREDYERITHAQKNKPV